MSMFVIYNNRDGDVQETTFSTVEDAFHYIKTELSGYYGDEDDFAVYALSDDPAEPRDRIIVSADYPRYTATEARAALDRKRNPEAWQLLKIDDD